MKNMRVPGMFAEPRKRKARVNALIREGFGLEFKLDKWQILYNGTRIGIISPPNYDGSRLRISKKFTTFAENYVKIFQEYNGINSEIIYHPE